MITKADVVDRLGQIQEDLYDDELVKYLAHLDNDCNTNYICNASSSKYLQRASKSLDDLINELDRLVTIKAQC